jgi:hypothetical protein
MGTAIANREDGEPMAVYTNSSEQINEEWKQANKGEFRKFGKKENK